jgi:predicted TIM-barrel fold metal-dependent hydrolase
MRTDEAAEGEADRRYMIVSADDHAGPRPARFFREFCPPQYLDTFDSYCRELDALKQHREELIDQARARIAAGNATVRDYSFDLHGLCRDCEGHHDPAVRLRDMDADGVAAQVIFAGGQNDTELPWSGFGWNAGPSSVDPKMREAAYHMWNEWIVEYCKAAPARLHGVMQTPIWDIDAAVREVEWCAERGIHVVNLPAPREDYPTYTDLAYEPFWAACQSANATLATHAGASAPFAPDVRRHQVLAAAEFHWYGNRGLAHLILGGVFERYPGLKYVLTEQRVDFAPMMVKHLDSLYDNIAASNELPRDDLRGGILTQSPILFNEGPPILSVDPTDADSLPKRPSEYWRDHCYLSGSFLAPFEIALRHEVGLGNLMWGSDYPHSEGTFPDTMVSLRHTFAGIPTDEARQILGENAIGVYHLDREELRAIADRIGPRPSQLDVPVKADEIPAGRNWAFRNDGNFS